MNTTRDNCFYSEREIASGEQKGELLLRYLNDRGFVLEEERPRPIEKTAFIGDSDTLRRLVEQGCAKDSMACAVAAAGGHLEALQYLFSRSFPIHDACARFAAKNGDERTFAFLMENGASYNKCLSAAAWGKNLEQWQPRDIHVWDLLWTNRSFVPSLLHDGHVAIIDILRRRGNFFGLDDVVLCIGAALGGSVSALRVLCEAEYAWDARTFYAAAWCGHIDVVNYLHAAGCPSSYCGSTDFDSVCSAAPLGGQVQMLQHLLGLGYDFDEMVADAAGASGSAEVASVVRDNCEKCSDMTLAECEEYICNSAAKYGNLELLQLMVGDGYKLDRPLAYEAAAAEGHHAVLKYLDSLYISDYLRDDRLRSTVASAATSAGDSVTVADAGDTDATARVNPSSNELSNSSGKVDSDDDFLDGCDDTSHGDCKISSLPKETLEKRACAAAASAGSVVVLQYLHNNMGYRWDEESCAMAAKSCREDALEYLYWSGCPWSHKHASYYFNSRSPIIAMVAYETWKREKNPIPLPLHKRKQLDALRSTYQSKLRRPHALTALYEAAWEAGVKRVTKAEVDIYFEENEMRGTYTRLLREFIDKVFEKKRLQNLKATAIQDDGELTSVIELLDRE